MGDAIKSTITKEERLKLDKLIRDADDYKDNTEHIRTVKHSKQLIMSVGVIELLKIQYAHIRHTPEFIELCKDKCPFIYNKYTDIFNKLVKDELDLQILSQFLQVLKAIEESQVDQQEGSVIVGKLLKEMYIDSALKRGYKLDAQNAGDVSGAAVAGAAVADAAVAGAAVAGAAVAGDVSGATIESRGLTWQEFKRNKELFGPAKKG